MKKQPRNVLLIAYYYPPIKSIGVMRSYQLSRQLAKRMENVIVLTTSNRRWLLQEPLPLPDVQIEELRTFDYRWLFSRLSRKKSTHRSAKPGSGLISRLWLLFKDSFPTNLLIDEGGPFYLFHGFLKARRLIRSHNITVIYSSFRPYADHLIAWALKRSYPELYWIADFRDLQIDLNRKNVYWPRFQHWCNRKILAHADRVITVSDGLATQLKHYRPDVLTVRNGVQFRTPVHREATAFTIVYTGSIYPGFQSPEPLLKVLAELIAEGQLPKQRLQLIYAGKDSAIWQDWIHQYQLDDCFIDRGMVSLKTSLQLQEQAHLNLLLSWAGPQLKGILTGKLYEYLGAQNPILLLIKGERDPEFETLFEQLQAGKIVYEQATTTVLKSYILALFQEWSAHGKLENRFNVEALKAMSWEARMEEIIAGSPFA